MSIAQQTPPNLIGQTSPEFRKNDFEAATWNKGYTVIWEKAFKCPCRTQATDNLSSCQNCGATGWVFINPVRTRAILHSLNTDTKFKVWSEEKLGTASATVMQIDKIDFMDRMTVEDSEAYLNERLYPKIETVSGGSNLFAATIYDIVSIEDIFLFESTTTPLKRLVLDTDYTFERNKIIFDASYKALTNMTVSVKYVHQLQYHVIDIPHDVRNSYKINDSGQEENQKLPVNAIVRRSHYVLDAENFNGDRMIDNSYTDTIDYCG